MRTFICLIFNFYVLHFCLRYPISVFFQCSSFVFFKIHFMDCRRSLKVFTRTADIVNAVIHNSKALTSFSGCLHRVGKSIC